MSKYRKVNVSFPMDGDVHNQLKIKASRKDMSISKYIEYLILNFDNGDFDLSDMQSEPIQVKTYSDACVNLLNNPKLEKGFIEFVTNCKTRKLTPAMEKSLNGIYYKIYNSNIPCYNKQRVDKLLKPEPVQSKDEIKSKQIHSVKLVREEFKRYCEIKDYCDTCGHPLIVKTKDGLNNVYDSKTVRKTIEKLESIIIGEGMFHNISKYNDFDIQDRYKEYTTNMEDTK